MGIRVLDAGTGRPLTYVRAVDAVGAARRTWHDSVADSLVVRTTDRGDEFGRPVR